MGKQMKRAFPDALNGELKKRGITQKELAEDLQMDRKTLRAINNGEPVKDATLQKVANNLKIPVDHLLEATGAVSSEEDSITDQVGANSILLRPVKAADLRALLTGAEILNWKVLLDKIDSDNHNALIDFERMINRWWDVLKSGEAKESLSEQLAHLKIASDCEEFLEKLNAGAIHVLAGEYLWWAENKGEHEEQYWFEFTSQKVAILALAPSSRQSKRIEIDLGDVPPTAATAISKWPVFVNGVQINARRTSFSRDWDDEVPS